MAGARSGMWFLSPGPVHRRLGPVCLAAGAQRGVLPPVGPRVLPHWVAVVVSAGEGWFRAGRGPVREVAAPVLLWLVPGVEHHYGPSRRTGWDEAFVSFAGPSAEAYAELGWVAPGSPVVPLRPGEPARAARAAADRIAEVARRGGPAVEAAAAALVPALLLALREARADVPERAPLLAALARDAFLPLSVEERAARLGLTVDQLRALARREAGRGPKEYVTDLRLARAQELLASTRTPVAAVARQVGFEDPAYFSRVFARRVGVAPRAFREREAPGGGPEPGAGPGLT